MDTQLDEFTDDELPDTKRRKKEPRLCWSCRQCQIKGLTYKNEWESSGVLDCLCGDCMICCKPCEGILCDDCNK